MSERRGVPHGLKLASSGTTPRDQLLADMPDGRTRSRLLASRLSLHPSSRGQLLADGMSRQPLATKLAGWLEVLYLSG